MAETDVYYKAKCPHCGQIDIVYGGQKTHKCSSCGSKNKLDINDPTINVGIAENPFQPQYLQVSCPYCGNVETVPVGEKRHRCSLCRGLYEVIYDDGTKKEAKDKSTPKLFQSDNQSGNNVDVKKSIKNILIVAAIIVGIVSLFSLFSSNDSDPMPTRTDSSVMVGVKSYLRETLKDPKSYQEIEWSPSGVNDAGQYYIRHKYRAKNSFGGYVVEEKIFYLNKSYKVVRTQDY